MLVNLGSRIPVRARRWAWRLAARCARGTRVFCPVCRTSLRFFLPFGVGGRLRSNALCPSCRSLERDRLAWLHLSSSPERLTPKTRLLHVAPEQCFEPRLRELLGAAYLTADLSRQDVDRQMSVEDMPFHDQTFDAVICNHVLEHVHDDRQALREIYRVLRPGGWALLQVPLSEHAARTIEDPSVTSAAERRKRFGQHDHVRAYGRDYTERLGAAGFALELQRARDTYLDCDMAFYGLDAAETLHFCRRPR